MRTAPWGYQSPRSTYASMAHIAGDHFDAEHCSSRRTPGEPRANDGAPTTRTLPPLNPRELIEVKEERATRFTRV